MRNKLFVLMSLLVMASMLLTACGQQPATQAAPTAAASTAASESAAEPTKAPEAAAPVSAVEFKNPDTITYITGAGEPETLDPAWTYETAGSTTELNIYEGLTFFKREKTDEFIPALATDWKTSDDGLTWTFNIRKGVKFHEGGTLEPHDVAYTAQRAFLQGRIDGWQWIVYEAFYGPDMAMAGIKDFAAAFSAPAGAKEPPKFETLKPEQLVKVCEDVKTKIVADDDAGTVTYHFKQPVPWMLALTSQQFLGGILDKEWMAENGDWDGDCKTWTKYADPSAENTILFKKANGTGPYKLDHWTPGEEIVLTANENYWRTEPMWEGGPSGVASIKRVVIKNVDEWGTRLSMLQAGDADEIYTPPQYRKELEPFAKQTCGTDESSCKDDKADGFLTYFRKLPMPAITPGQFNWQMNVEGGNPYIGSGKLDGNGIPANFFSDIHIRKAFSACFDYDAMVKDALAGEGVQAQGPIPQGMMGYLKDQAPLNKFDTATCEAEFKKADLDGDGKAAGEDDDDIWSKGFYMQIAYNTGNDTRRMAAEILKAGIESVNPKFTVAVLAMPWPVLLESRRQGKLPIYVGGWVEDYHDPHNWVNPFLYSQGAYGRIVNMTADYKKKYDDIIISGAKANGVEARTPIYESIQKMAQEDAVDIWMYQQMEGFPFQSWIKGFYFNPAYGNPEYGWIYSLSKVAPK
ncbi:ABC transporter substrate-binding protein [Leptolinea tardivitalis]|uniref:ABC transporter substrate-binding protein n=1 Tax=Leptolinea tardivitalis TaxID=229920 RepID=UPI0007850F72|nr:ABC transporter substrate-binding protein [Leptolinea tardivitalis]GAP22382.1 ABC-type dipeptide transport system, periplasmic component [Leptolinea tardivitalis]